MPVSIALVDDNTTFRQRLMSRLQFFEDEVRVVFSANSGTAILDMLRSLVPDDLPEVVLMDIEMPGGSGIETTQRLTAQWPDVAVIMLTVFEQDDAIFDAVKAGASGYLLKDASVDSVVNAILQVHDGGAPMSPLVARKVLESVRSPLEAKDVQDDASSAETFSLTARETEVLTLLVEAHTEAYVADLLHISPHTVRSHIKNIYKKLHVHSRAAMVRVALKHNLVDDG